MSASNPTISKIATVLNELSYEPVVDSDSSLKVKAMASLKTYFFETKQY